MKFTYNKNNNKSGLDLTPILDMIFIVLIFFMVAATFDLNRTIQLVLPKSLSGESNISKDKILIEVDGNGDISLNGEMTDLQDVSYKIKEIENYTQCTVYLLGDKDANYKYIIDIIDVLKIIGIADISLVTEDKEDF